MSTTDSPLTITVRVQRFNPDVNPKPYLQSFKLQWEQIESVV